MDELVKTALTEEWRSSFALPVSEEKMSTVDARLPTIVSDVSFTEAMKKH